MSVARKALALSVSTAQDALTEKLNLHRLMLFSPTRETATQLSPVSNSHLLTNENKALGRHWLADFKISDDVKNALLAGDAKENIAALVLAAANVAKATVLNQVTVRQEETGNIVSLVVIQESHLSIHVLTDKNIVLVDVFTCGLIRFQAAIDYISEKLAGKPQSYLEMQRGLMLEDKFIPGIAWEVDKKLLMLPSGYNQGKTSALARHVIMEVYLCDFATINNGEWIKEAFGKAIVIAGGKLQDNFMHQFSPQGVSEVSIGRGLQVEFGAHCHLTIHSYPEFGYAAVDVFDATQQLNLELM
ncbi:MAG: S-adenosylmethionine decarboxylase, partial [Pseudomonadota bacterium]